MPKVISRETYTSLPAVALFSEQWGWEIDNIHYQADKVTILAHTTTLERFCPTCGHGSTRIHCYYTRCPRDLPLGEQRVSLHLRVRRFRCRNTTCPQQTFGERLPTFLPMHAQRTLRLTTTLHQVGLALGGEAGARLTQLLRMPTSAATLLRIIRQQPAAQLTTPRVLGVDDFALRKGRTYGTLLLDLEQHRPIELLPDRTAATLRQWLQAHPGVEMIVRDRSTEYARGASEGAPSAQQVADRWHLLQNLRQMLERLFTRLSGSLRYLPRVTAPSREATNEITTRSVPFWRTHGEETSSQASREQRVERYMAVQQLRSAGHKIEQIARMLGLAKGTVRKYFYAPTFPERAQQAPKASLLDPYLPYLLHRQQAGCENAQQLWREIRDQGYPGTPKQVERWLQQRRTQPAPTTPSHYEMRPQPPAQQQALSEIALPSTKQLAWLLMQDKEQLTATDMDTLHRICQHPELQVTYPLVQQFVTMVRQHTAAYLDNWLTACALTRVPNLQTFAAGLQQDYAAVRAALATPWSNGQTEGQVNRLKFIKRQMYGRANFDLLRLRVLAA